MHIVIPMSGLGTRFVNAGYNTPKPLIVIDGKPIIEHVCDLFPGEDKFTFICNAQHLKETNMRSILKSIKPRATIVEIQKHKKGPVFAVSLIQHLIEDDEEVIVNYCDFGTYWDYLNFLSHTRNRKADGAIPAYKGFHPHMLGSTNYAFMREENQMMLEIKEKEPFTNNRNMEYASNGTYYFRKGLFVKKYFQELMDKDINLKGEYYVSLIYNLLVEDGLKVSIYEIQHMLQWGIPSDVEEYNRWSKYFRNAVNQYKKPEPKKDSITLIPLAGLGSRFSKSGYASPKPLINVSGKPMIIQAANSLPKSEKHIFVILKEHLDNYKLDSILKEEYPNADIVSINEVTKGQAITCKLGLNDVNLNSSLLISATDNGIIYDAQKFNTLVLDENVDVVVFTFKNHPSSRENPEMYGWVKTEQGDDINGVSVKVPISKKPFDDHAIVGTFYFKKVSYFNDALEAMLLKKHTVNGEYYVDSLINELVEKGLNAKTFLVDDYIGWGTPNDYETFRYWQSFFHKVSWHPYSLENDITVNKSNIKELDAIYRTFNQEND